MAVNGSLHTAARPLLLCSQPVKYQDPFHRSGFLFQLLLMQLHVPLSLHKRDNHSSPVNLSHNLLLHVPSLSRSSIISAFSSSAEWVFNSDFHSSIPFFLKNYAGQKIRPAIMLNALIIANLLPKVNAAHLDLLSRYAAFLLPGLSPIYTFRSAFISFGYFSSSKFTLNSNPQLLDLVPDDSVRAPSQDRNCFHLHDRLLYSADHLYYLLRSICYSSDMRVHPHCSLC